MFDDRADAGQRLADHLREQGVTADIVLAIPRGGLPVASVVADALGVPLDVVVARKVGAPDNPELAVAAVAADGAVWRNEDLIGRLGVSEAYLEGAIDRERVAAIDKLAAYRGDRPPLDLAGKDVLIVDDGVATGATTAACVRLVRQKSPASVVVAVPVAPPETIARLRADADDVVAVETPREFSAVGAFYRTFGQVPDAEARAFLADDETGGDQMSPDR
jgi:predicted phosphoribosyltransferase